MLTNIATGLAGLIDLAILLLGVSGLWRPHAAVGFGIPDTPVDEPTFRAWLRVKAVRDFVFGVALLILLLGGAPAQSGWFILAMAAIPVGDALIVARAGGPKSTIYGVHTATAAFLMLVGILLLAA